MRSLFLVSLLPLKMPPNILPKPEKNPPPRLLLSPEPLLLDRLPEKEGISPPGIEKPLPEKSGLLPLLPPEEGLLPPNENPPLPCACS